MYQFASDGALDLDQLRARLCRMDDAMLRHWGSAARRA